MKIYPLHRDVYDGNGVIVGVEIAKLFLYMEHARQYLYNNSSLKWCGETIECFESYDGAVEFDTEQLRKSGLSKLTVAEREALGV